MKQIPIIIASILFSILFFEKHLGLNLTLFSVVTTALLIISNPGKFRHKAIIVYTAAYLLTAAFVFVQQSQLSIIANCISFFTLVGAVSERQTSVYVNWLNGIYTSVTGFFHRTLEPKTVDGNATKAKDIDVWHLVKLIGIPAIFIVVFVLLYQHGNPVFEGLVSKINFDFVNIQWLLFTVLGYYLLSNITVPVQVEPATSLDRNTSNDLHKTGTYSEEKLKKEKQLGTTLLSLLNLLLVFYIVTDIIYLLSNTATSASVMSAQVHNGINTLIASIIIAIVIILYVFRGNLNFYEDNRILKQLTYVWIFLNMVLIALIAMKNQTYITSFGLTYKRIGVHIYILLAGIGLITTFLKVLNIKNLAFLFRKNTQIALFVLIVASTLNWDAIITKYNLQEAQSFDVNYLIELSDRNAQILYLNKSHSEISPKQKLRIDQKYENYVLKAQQNNWQEHSYQTLLLDQSQPQKTTP